jgi:hypothetical protein
LKVRTFFAGAVSAVVLLAGVACGGGDDEPGDTPTPEAPAATVAGAAESPTPAPTVAGATVSQDFRTFVPQIVKAVDEQDIEFFAEHAWTEQVVCTEQHVAIEGFFAACKEVGEQFQGLGLSVWRVEGGGLVPGERVLALIDSMWTAAVTDGDDAYGGAQAEVYALGANPRLGYEAQLAVITALIARPAGMPGTGPLRVAIVTHWRFEEDDWRLFEVMQSVEATEDLLEPSIQGGAYIQSWERYQP